jgi:hypothetical protein
MDLAAVTLVQEDEESDEDHYASSFLKASWRHSTLKVPYCFSKSISDHRSDVDAKGPDQGGDELHPHDWLVNALLMVVTRVATLRHGLSDGVVVEGIWVWHHLLQGI